MKQHDHIHSVIVSFNRWELTQQAITTYLETVTLPATLMVVDNCSSPKVQKALQEMAMNEGFGAVVLDQNRFPGFATNYGWNFASDKTTIFHRADNDFAFLPGWCDQVLHALENRAVGQVGLRTDAEELWNPHNVGGNCVIRRKLWDLGLRYDERPWGEGYDPGWTEDSLLSPEVVRLGFRWTRVKEPCIRPISQEDPNHPDYDREYYEKSWGARGIKPPQPYRERNPQ